MRRIGLLELTGFAVMAAAALSCPAGPALAATAKSADAAACAQLTSEQQSLVDLGVKRNMEKGAEWARVNLSQGDLNLIQHFIDVSERIKFRCMPPEFVVHLKIEDTGDENGDDDNEPAKDAADKAGATGDNGADREKAGDDAAPPLPKKRGETPPAKKPAAVVPKKPQKPKPELAKKTP